MTLCASARRAGRGVRGGPRLLALVQAAARAVSRPLSSRCSARRGGGAKRRPQPDASLPDLDQPPPSPATATGPRSASPDDAESKLRPRGHHRLAGHAAHRRRMTRLRGLPRHLVASGPGGLGGADVEHDAADIGLVAQLRGPDRYGHRRPQPDERGGGQGRTGRDDLLHDGQPVQAQDVQRLPLVGHRACLAGRQLADVRDAAVPTRRRRRVERGRDRLRMPVQGSQRTHCPPWVGIARHPGSQQVRRRRRGQRCDRLSSVRHDAQQRRELVLDLRRQHWHGQPGLGGGVRHRNAGAAGGHQHPDPVAAEPTAAVEDQRQVQQLLQRAGRDHPVSVADILEDEAGVGDRHRVRLGCRRRGAGPRALEDDLWLARSGRS
jgi:hypothetical protein